MLPGHCTVSGAHEARWRVGFWRHVEAVWLSDKHILQQTIDFSPAPGAWGPCLETSLPDQQP